MPATAPSETLSRSIRMIYGVAALAPTGVAVAAVLLGSTADLEWYRSLLLPSFDPPLWLADMLWVLVELIIAYAFFRVLCRPDWMPDRPGAIRAFAVQAVLAILWPLVFFAPRSPAAGAVAMSLLLIGTMRTGWLFGAVDRKAGVLLMLGVAWIAFETLLMLSIYIRN